MLTERQIREKAVRGRGWRPWEASGGEGWQEKEQEEQDEDDWGGGSRVASAPLPQALSQV